MDTIYTTSKNKNPMIKFVRNQLKNKKPQKSIGPKTSSKMHENCE